MIAEHPARAVNDFWNGEDMSALDGTSSREGTESPEYLHQTTEVSLVDVAATLKDLKAQFNEHAGDVTRSFGRLHDRIDGLEANHVDQLIGNGRVPPMEFRQAVLENPAVSVDIEAETKAIRRIAKYLSDLPQVSQIRVMRAVEGLIGQEKEQTVFDRLAQLDARTVRPEQDGGIG